jgi:hypothetical protein
VPVSPARIAVINDVRPVLDPMRLLLQDTEG